MLPSFALLVCFVTACVVSQIQFVGSHRLFQQRIPNGDRVPHPCRQHGGWPGVGHMSSSGGGARNQFGADFVASGQVWTASLCQMDSDGDGISNGAELGDPSCRWEPGDRPEVTDIDKLSHPGVCTPLDSQKCRKISRDVPWITKECGNTKTSCPAMEEEGITKENVHLPESRVPGKTTTYMCMDYIIKSNKTLHMVATTPIIKERNIVHHMLLFGCHSDNSGAWWRSPGQAYECGMLPACHGNIISMWAFGMDIDCSYNDVGFRLGPSGYTRLVLQVHWNNRFEHTHYKDSSGMTLYLTKHLREYDAGVWVIGSVYLDIPPRMTSYVTQATCARECTGVYMAGPVNITGLLNHMHYLGQSIKVEVIRGGNRYLLAEDKTYDYDNPTFHVFSKPFQVFPGDELITTCDFNSMSTNLTTYWGESTRDEMCFAFVTYYPAEHVRETMCYSWEMIPRCYHELGLPFQGCDFIKILTSGTDGWLGKVLRRLTNSCDATTCKAATCMPVVLELRTHPCLHGQIYNYIRMNIGGSMELFHQLYTSCDIQIDMADNRATRASAVMSLSQTADPVGRSIIFLLNWLIFRLVHLTSN